MRLNRLIKVIGPGLLFASTAIGTSHLVLSTRAGAHYGLIYLAIVLGALFLKYPFFEFAPRYTLATGSSILHSYRRQGRWAIMLFLLIIGINMFAVTGALAAVCAGLISSYWGFSVTPLVGITLGLTCVILIWGRYRFLDGLIKVISVVLLLTVCTAFGAVLVKGPLYPQTSWEPMESLWQGAGLTLLVSLIGFMPTGMEAAAMNSLWIVEKQKSERTTLKEGLFDFNLGYLFTTVLALMFVVIGALTVFGSGNLLEGNSTQFSNKLMSIFTANLGSWTYPVIATAAFGTIYGTLITAMDAFARCFVASWQLLKSKDNSQGVDESSKVGYTAVLVLISAGAFILFAQFTGGMIKILEFATIVAFLGAPIVAFLNLRAVRSPEVPVAHRPTKWMYYLAYLGLVAMMLFSCYYLINLRLL